MKRSLSSLLGLATVAISAAFARSAFAQAPEFAVARIDEQLGLTSLSWGAALNNDGDAVGYAFVSSVTNAYVYTYEHGAVLLPMIGGNSTARAIDISRRDANGVVDIIGDVGFSSIDPSNPNGSVAVFWRYSTATNTVVDSGIIGMLPNATHSLMRGVNDQGMAVGYSGGGTGGVQPMVYDIDSATLSSFSFPTIPADINNLEEVIGGTFVGDLNGNAVDIGIPATSASAGLVEITDNGWIIAGVTMPFTDGAGRFVKGAARYDGVWDLVWANSAFDTGSGINSTGDMVGLLGISAAIRPALYWAATDQLFLLSDLITPTQPLFADGVADINDGRQIITSFPAAVLTPLGSMVIPGDVNGDAQVTLSDLCAWLNNPIDLDNDGDTDADDEQWLIDRLTNLALVPQDCNANGNPDTCDIESGASFDCNADGIADDCQADCDGDGIADECESDCNGNGTPDDCDLIGGTSDDCNANGIPDECDGADTVTYVTTYSPGQILVADDTFTDSVLVTDVGITSDVDVTLNLDYRIGNIIVRLSHAGTTVTLVDRPGFPANPSGNGQLGYRITLDDEGTGPNIENVGNFGSPFEPIESPPSYQPHEPLSAFSGLPRDGDWTLEITTIGPGSHFDPKVNEWSVIVTDTAVPVGVCADIDGDGDLDMDDALALVAVLVDAPINPMHIDRSDLNHDGRADGRDIQALIDAILP